MTSNWRQFVDTFGSRTFVLKKVSTSKSVNKIRRFDWLVDKTFLESSVLIGSFPAC